MEKAKMSEESPKMLYKCEEIAKNGPTGANLEPQETKPSLPDGVREPRSLLRKERNPSVTLRKPIQVIKLNNTKPLVHYLIQHAYVVPEPPRVVQPSPPRRGPSSRSRTSSVAEILPLRFARNINYFKG